ncbi:EF-hand calcium-binding domain-containing protein 11 isoform X1 [Bos javanicus]|uniref:EF-hand calcium-binding domain-containing protein 11 isoform X1 n=2 Tax=Bos javanicus TaxID=9906 RepID=UPI002AA903E8|nr:EF-hand calcium-binding domain-containing protein 11 isoform X1 [Bos javanicus]
MPVARRLSNERRRWRCLAKLSFRDCAERGWRSRPGGFGRRARGFCSLDSRGAIAMFCSQAGARPRTWEASPPEHKKWVEVFKACDEDNKGYLSREDFKVAVVMLFGYKPSKIEADSVMSSVDPNTSGIRLKEFLDIVRKKKEAQLYRNEVRHIFTAFDRHYRGYLTLEDFKKAFKQVAPKLSERIILEVFRTKNDTVPGPALCCCSVAQSCPTLCNPVDCSTPGFRVLHYLLELVKLMPIESVMPSNHLILSCPLLLLPSIFPSIRVFSNEPSLHVRWPEYWSFSISPSNEYSGLISFRMDWLDLLAVQGTLKNLLQHHSWRSINSLALSLLYGPTLTSIHDYWKNHSFDYVTSAK